MWTRACWILNLSRNYERKTEWNQNFNNFKNWNIVGANALSFKFSNYTTTERLVIAIRGGVGRYHWLEMTSFDIAKCEF